MSLDYLGGGNAVTISQDAFGRQRVSNPTTIFDSQLQYDEVDLDWNEKLAGAGAVTHDAAGSFAILSVGTTSGDGVIRQSPYQRYQSGKSQLLLASFDFAEAVTNCVKRVGYFDDDNGIYLEMDGSAVSVVLRSKVSGSVVNTSVAQAAWNGDRHDGNGASGITLDLTKSQVFWCDMEWLGSGTVRCGFYHFGRPHVVHSFHNTNVANKPYMTTANLPVRYQITNDGTLGSTTLMRQVCSTVVSEGGFATDFGFTFAAGNGATGISVTTRRAILSIRPKATFNSIIVRALILPVEFGVFVTGKDAFVELIYNPTLGGTPSWASVNDDSLVEFDIAGTTISGGIVIAHEHIPVGQGKGAAIANDIAARYPLHHDIDGNNPTHLTIAVTSLSTAAVSYGHQVWREIR